MFSSSKDQFARFLALWTPAEKLLESPRPRLDALQIDRDILRAALGLGRKGKRPVEQHHRAAFESTQGQALPEFVSQEAAAALELSRREAALQKDAALASRTDRTIGSAEKEAEIIAWNGWDRTQAIAYFGGSLALNYVGMRSLAMLLESSGLPIFYPAEVANRYLFSFLTFVGLGLSLKGAWSHLIKTDAGRVNFAWVITIIAVGASVCWSWLFAQGYGGGLSSEPPPIGLPLGDEIEEGGGHGGIALTFCALIGEAFGAAALWIFGSMLMEKHGRTPRIPKPAFVEIETRMELCNREIAYLRDLGSRLRGRIEVIHRSTDVFAGRAVARFDMAIQAAARASMADKDIEEEVITSGLTDHPAPAALEEGPVNPLRGSLLTEELTQRPPQATEHHTGNSHRNNSNNSNGATQ